MNLRMLGAIIVLAILWYARPAPADGAPSALRPLTDDPGPVQTGPARCVQAPPVP